MEIFEIIIKIQEKFAIILILISKILLEISDVLLIISISENSNSRSIFTDFTRERKRLLMNFHSN